MVNENIEGLEIPANGSGVHTPILNETVAKNIKKELRRLSDVHQGLVFAKTVVLMN